MLSPEQSFRPLSNADLMTTFMAEMSALDRVIKQPDFLEILEDILNYRTFLDTRRQSAQSVTQILKAMTGGKSVIEVSRMSPEVRRIISTAHLAACCILLDKFRFNLEKLGSGNLLSEMQKYISGPGATEPPNALAIMHKLHGVDAVRIIQLLRITGFITRLDSEMFQLGLGAANGCRDIDYAHTEPAVFMDTGPDGDEIMFSSLKRIAADIIVGDLDPRYENVYQKFSMNTSSGTTGYVSDVYSLLDLLAGKNITKRNLITMFRVEPDMLPDIAGFLRSLTPIVAESCDLVISIGAGDSPEAFTSRVGFMADIYDLLQSIGFEPVLIKLHLGGTIMQQASSLQYGNAATASYEVIYCLINNETMEKVFNT